MNPATIQVQLGSMTLREDGILHVVFDSTAEATRDAAAEFVAAREALVGQTATPVIVELRAVSYVDRDIRMFVMSELTPPRCRAVVTADLSLRVIFKTFQTADPDPTPTEFFTTVDAAVIWINSVLSGDADHTAG